MEVNIFSLSLISNEDVDDQNVDRVPCETCERPGKTYNSALNALYSYANQFKRVFVSTEICERIFISKLFVNNFSLSLDAAQLNSGSDGVIL